MTETKAQHTPEWKIGLAKAQAHDWKITLWATDNYMVQGIAYQDGYNQAKAEDAHLLEALQALVSCCEALDHNMASPSTAGWVRLRSVVAVARAAIAHATGEETAA